MSNKDETPKPGPHIGASLSGDDYRPQIGKFRCNSTGGIWRNTLKFPDWDECEVDREIERVLASLSSADSRIALAELYDLINSAQEGQLGNEDPADFSELPHFPPLLELRIQINPDAPEAVDRILLRYYFAEPPDFADLLLGLKFAKKPSGEDRHGKQDQHIRDAYFRYKQGQRNGNTWGLDLKKW